jgi:AbrB family looped-hinge helix DNA binding protein
MTSKKDKYMGVCKVGEKGQIVIPKEARDMFGISPGDSVVVLCDRKKGIAVIKADVFDTVTEGIFKK